ncbi:hypothetical protein CPB86DRAFT_872242 [Serendipita vermifera]|nr:hypothetical protein CPB86DRAFT_872242 [Serendipita vermifera]
MIHIATLSALFIAIFVQVFPQYVPNAPVQAPTWVFYVFYTLLFLRWPIGPFVLNKVSKGAAMVDSVSLRSIKGIRFTIRNLVTVECDRIGYSIRLFGKKANRRIGITFNGLRIVILHVPKKNKNAADPSKRAQGSSSSPSPEPIVVTSDAQESSANKASPILEWLKSILPASWVQDLDDLSRAWIRYLFSLAFDFVLQVGPSIISTLSIRFSSVQVTFAELGGVNFSLSQASIGIAVNLEVVKEHQMTEEQRKELRAIQRSKAKSWKDRLTGSFSRTFQAAWKGRQGEASVFLKLENFTLFNPTPPVPKRRPRAQSTVSLESNWVHFTDIDMVAPDNAVVHIPGETEFSVKCDFDPRKGTIAHHSARINASIASVTVFVDVLQVLLDDARSMMPTTPKTSGFSSPPQTPMSPPPSASLLSLSPPSTPRFSLSPRRAKVVKQDKPQDRNVMRYFKSAGISLPLFTIQYTSVKSREPIQYKSQIKGLDLGLKLSDPKEDALHVKWLGKNGKPTLETCKAWFRFTEIIVHRDHDLTSEDGLVRIINTSGLNAEVLLHQFPTPLLKRTGDTTEPFIACEIDMDSIEATETLHLIRKRLARPSLPKSSKQAPSQQVFTNVPKVALDMKIGEIKGRLICDDEKAFPTDVGLDLVLEGAEFHVRSDYEQFKSPQKSSQVRGTRVSDCFPSMVFRVDAAIHKPVIHTVHATGEDDGTPTGRPRLGAPSHQGPEKRDEPIVTLEGLDLGANGNLLGKWDGDSIVLERRSLMADASLIIDLLHVDLLTLNSLSILTHFVTQTKLALAKSARSSNPKPASNKSILDLIPVGVQLHAAIGDLSVSVTGKDLNPDCDLDLYRGVLFRTSCMFRYASVNSSLHNSRSRHRFKAAIARDQLRLPEDLLMQAFSYANESDDSRAVSGLTEIVFTGTALKRIVGSQYGVDDIALNDIPNTVGPSGLTLSIPRARVRSFLTRRPTEAHVLTDKIAVVFDISVISCHFQLLDAYCAFLALQTVKRIFTAESKPKPKPTQQQVTVSPPPQQANKLVFVANGQIASMQMICSLPLSEILHLRWSAVSLAVVDAKSVELKWTAASVLVPCAQTHKDRRWEEIGRLPSWKIGVKIDEQTKKPTIDVIGDCARIRIPNGFVLADTILSITVAVKAMKQLVTITSDGVFSQMPVPRSEPAKKVPRINVKIESLMFEATDSKIDSRLNIVFRNQLLAQRMRIEHEDAFDAKVAKIESAKGKNGSLRRANDWNFSTQHSVDVQVARDRLRELFSNLWISQIQDAYATATSREESMTMRFREGKTVHMDTIPSPALYVPPSLPPLFRLTLNGVSVSVGAPDWDEEQRAAWMEEVGDGLPRDTEFTLLIPLHLHIAVSSARFVLRDIPLPLLNIPTSSDGKSLLFETDLVIGEEIGPDSNIRWVECDVAPANADATGAVPFNILIPKTTMPVKTYALPDVHVKTTGITDLSWGVSFIPIIQELMKVIDAMTTVPIDPSPPLGFWDKLPLVLHWRVNVKFDGEVHVHLKGSRDVWKTSGNAVGIALCSKRNTRITIGHSNPENEVVQFLSDDMLIVVPSLKHFEQSPSGLSVLDYEVDAVNRQPQKIIAKLVNGVRIGAGFKFERACRSDCNSCPADADPFHRSCRLFTFKPHHQVALRVGPSDDGKDSFEGFRSDFIHLAISMHSPINPGSKHSNAMNSIHLTPRVFAHFWAWIRLFDDTLALPIRNGPIWPGVRPPSEKFGKHLATLKYRFSLDNLAISHTYKQDSQDSWANGEIPAVGVKAIVKSLRADLHQRDQEIRTRIQKADGTSSFKYTRSKAFFGAEVSLSDIYMRAVVAIFREPDLQDVVTNAHPDYESPYAIAPHVSTDDPAFDIDDYTELDWLPTDQSPKFFMGEVASCPQVSFVKKLEEVRLPSDDPEKGAAKMSKFGSEDSHVCLMGMELDPRVVQLNMATERKAALEKELSALDPSDVLYDSKHASLIQRIRLLAADIEKLSNPPPSATPSRMDGQLHGNWSETDWEPFDNLYTVHAPKLSLTNGTRNMLLQYYYESRRRRGFEYHMASSAVRFLREHATMSDNTRKEETRTAEKVEPSAPSRSKSTKAVKRLFSRQQEPRKTQDVIAGPADIDVNLGAFQHTETQRNHFCLLYKPQIVLKSNLDDESVIIIAANDAALQTMNIMDTKVTDAVNAHILTKNYVILSGMQLFSPSLQGSTNGKGMHLPYEVFLDDLCETIEYERIVMHTSCVVQYDKYNRLRLRTASQATPHSDILLANVPRFTLQANSDHFSSLYNVVTDLLLYADPSNRSRLDRLESFILNDDISDSATTVSEIVFRQNRIRSLIEQLNDFTLQEGNMRASDRRQMNTIAANMMNQIDELGLIFDAIQLVQDRDEVSSQNKVGIRLEASSTELTWNLMDMDGSLMARLALRSMDFLWISSQDGSSANRLKIKDLEAIDRRPNAKFPEMISKQKKWLADHPMAKTNTLIDVIWNTAAPVGGISILTNFDLSFHPINVQFDASVGHKIQSYIFPKDRSLRYHSSPEELEHGRKSPDTPDALVTFHSQMEAESIVPGRSSFDERGRTLLKPSGTTSRSSSHSDLGRGQEDAPRLRRARSSHALDLPSRQQGIPGKAVEKQKVHDNLAEMRARSAENRTFVAARINTSGICLSFRRDKDLSVIIPDITDLYFETPEISFGNRTCSFRDILQEYKWELISKTGNVLLSGGGLKSFNFTGIKDRLLPGKRHHAPNKPEPPKVVSKQIGQSREFEQSEGQISTTETSDSSTAIGRNSFASNTTSSRKSASSTSLSKDSRRHGSVDSGVRGISEHGEDVDTHTPRKKLMSLLQISGSPRNSPSQRAKSLALPE